VFFSFFGLFVPVGGGFVEVVGVVLGFYFEAFLALVFLLG
jgi:hypothetical protein